MSDSFLEKVFAVPFACVLAVLPVLQMPFTAVSPALQKGILTALALGLILSATAVLITVRRWQITIPITPAVLAGVAFFIVACVSATRAISPEMAWWGLGFEISTAGSIALFTAAIFAGSLLGVRSIMFTLGVFIVATIVALAYTVGELLFGSHPAMTIAGPWTTLSFLIAAGMLSAALLGDWRTDTIYTVYTVVHWMMAALLCIGFILFFYVPAALITLAVCMSSIALLTRRADVERAHFPFATISIFVVIVACLLIGLRAPLFPVPPDVRPSLLAVELVTVPPLLHDKSTMILGTGANNFRNVWNQNRLPDFNTTSFWEMEPEVGFSTLTTLGIAFGMLGIAPVVLFFLFALYVAGQAMYERFSNVSTKRPDTYALAALVSLFAFSALFLDAPGIPVFLFVGLMLGFATSVQSTWPRFNFVIPETFLVRLAFAGILVACGIILIHISTHQLIAAHNYAVGMGSRQKGDRQTAVLLLERATHFWSASLYQRDTSRTLLELAKEESQQSTHDAEWLRDTIDRAISFADEAVNSDFKNYGVWMNRALLYIAIMSTGHPYAKERTLESLEQARELAPTRPDVPFLRAQYHLMLGDVAAARNDIAEALMLKPDYEPAKTLLKSL